MTVRIRKGLGFHEFLNCSNREALPLTGSLWDSVYPEQRRRRQGVRWARPSSGSRLAETQLGTFGHGRSCRHERAIDPTGCNRVSIECRGRRFT